jgi:hypothetical protein
MVIKTLYAYKKQAVKRLSRKLIGKGGKIRREEPGE